MTTDSVKQIGKYIGHTRDAASLALSKLHSNAPTVETIRDVFDDLTSFKMSINVTSANAVKRIRAASQDFAAVASAPVNQAFLSLKFSDVAIAGSVNCADCFCYYTETFKGANAPYFTLSRTPLSSPPVSVTVGITPTQNFTGSGRTIHLLDTVTAIDPIYISYVIQNPNCSTGIGGGGGGQPSLCGVTLDNFNNRTITANTVGFGTSSSGLLWNNNPRSQSYDQDPTYDEEYFSVNAGRGVIIANFGVKTGGSNSYYYPIYLDLYNPKQTTLQLPAVIEMRVKFDKDFYSLSAFSGGTLPSYGAYPMLSVWLQTSTTPTEIMSLATYAPFTLTTGHDTMYGATIGWKGVVPTPYGINSITEVTNGVGVSLSGNGSKDELTVPNGITPLMAGYWYRLKFYVGPGNVLAIKMWDENFTEPTTWPVQYALPAGVQWGTAAAEPIALYIVSRDASDSLFYGGGALMIEIDDISITCISGDVTGGSTYGYYVQNIDPTPNTPLFTNNLYTGLPTTMIGGQISDASHVFTQRPLSDIPNGTAVDIVVNTIDTGDIRHCGNMVAPFYFNFIYDPTTKLWHMGYEDQIGSSDRTSIGTDPNGSADVFAVWNFGDFNVTGIHPDGFTYVNVGGILP